MNKQPLDNGSASGITMPEDPVIHYVKSRTKPFGIVKPKDDSATDSASEPKTRDSSGDNTVNFKKGSSVQLEVGKDLEKPVDYELPSIKGTGEGGTGDDDNLSFSSETDSTFEPPQDAGPGTSTSAAPVDGNTGPLEENGRSFQVTDEPSSTEVDFHSFEDGRQQPVLERHDEAALGTGTSAGAAGRFEDVGRPMPTEAAGSAQVEDSGKDVEKPVELPFIKGTGESTFEPPQDAGPGTSTSAAPVDGNTGPLEENGRQEMVDFQKMQMAMMDLQKKQMEMMDHIQQMQETRHNSRTTRSSCQVDDEPDMDFHDFEDVRQVSERHDETALGTGTSAGAAGRLEDVGGPMPTEAAGPQNSVEVFIAPPEQTGLLENHPRLVSWANVFVFLVGVGGAVVTFVHGLLFVCGFLWSFFFGAE